MTIEMIQVCRKVVWSNEIKKLKRENRELKDIIDEQRESLVDIVEVKWE